VENSTFTTAGRVEADAHRHRRDDWSEEFYARADIDFRKVYWTDFKPNPLLLAWIEEDAAPAGKRAVTIGCGLGDDVAALARRGYRVTAFDFSPAAIEMCRQRYPDSDIHYQVGHLFSYPAQWWRRFDLVYECNTIQTLRGPSRARALQAIIDLVAPGGELLVSCRSRNEDEQLTCFTLALDRAELDGFRQAGLVETRFVAYDDDQEPPVPHFFACYKRLP